MYIILILIALSCAVYVVWSTRGWNKVKTLRQFFLIDGKLEHRGFWGTMVASNTAVANGFFLYTMLGFYLGWGAFIWSSIFWVVGLAVFALFARRLYPEFGNLVTLNEFLGNKSSRFAVTVRRAAAVITIVSFLLTLSMELVVGSEVIFAVLRANGGAHAVVPDWLKVVVPCLMSLILAVYLAANGFEAVRRSDMIQVALFIPGIIALGFIVLPKALPVLPQTSFKELMLLPKSWSFVVFSLFSWAFWFLVAMDMWVRCAAAGKAKSTGKPIWLSLVMLIPFTAVAVACGIYVKALAGTPYVPKPGDLFLQLLLQNSGVGVWVLSFVFVALVAAILSSVDTFLMVVTHSVFADIVHASSDYKVESVNERRRLTTVRMFLLCLPVLCAAGFSYVVYVAKSNVLAMNYMSYSLPLCLLPPVLLGLLKGRISGVATIAAAVLGFIAVGAFTVPLTIQIGQGVNVTRNYDLLYATPAISAGAGLVAYIVGAVFEPIFTKGRKQS